MAIVEFEAPVGRLLVDAAGIPAANSIENATSSAAADKFADSVLVVAEACEAKKSEANDSDNQALDQPATEDGNDAVDDSADDVSAIDAKPAVGSEVAGSEQSGKMVSYHLDSDLYIRIRDSAGTALHYKVCFALLAAASPALSQLVKSEKPTVSSGGKLVFDLSGLGDDAQGLDVVLSIVHYKFHEIPRRPDVDLLYSIAQVTEKFNCAHLLVPYTDKWYVHARWSWCEAGTEG